MLSLSVRRLLAMCQYCIMAISAAGPTEGREYPLHQPAISVVAGCSVGRDEAVLQCKLPGDIHMPVAGPQKHAYYACDK